MKKMYIVLVICCLSSAFAFGQFDKGQKLLGGSIGFVTTKYGDPADNFYTTDNSSFNFSPSIGWFSKPNRLSGISFSYGYNHYKYVSATNPSTQTTNNNTIALNYLSQRFFSLSQKLFFTVNSSIGGSYSFGINNSTMNNVEIKENTRAIGIGAQLAPGLSYRLTQRLLFDAYLSNLISLSYYNQWRKVPTTEDTRNVQKGFNVSTSLTNTNLSNVGLGFRWLLNK